MSWSHDLSALSWIFQASYQRDVTVQTEGKNTSSGGYGVKFANIYIEGEHRVIAIVNEKRGRNSTH